MFRFVQREKANHSVRLMCKVLKVSRSGYYKSTTRVSSARELEDETLKGLIRSIHTNSRGSYGSPRIHAELGICHDIHCSRKRVSRLMRELGIHGASRRRRFGCTTSNPKQAGYPDLVGRRFVADAPNQLWVADITQHMTSQGYLYIAVVMDVFSRMIIGWSMSARQTADMVLDALGMAIRKRRSFRGVTHHSDHGSQYGSLRFGSKLKEVGILGSMGSVGDALDNAVAESFFSRLQVELLDTRSWAARDELRLATFDYIEVFYNRQRRHSSLEYMTPVEYELRYAQEQRLGMAASA